VLEGEEGLKEGDLGKLDGLWGTLKRVGEAAREEGIKVAVDAEHSWYQVREAVPVYFPADGMWMVGLRADADVRTRELGFCALLARY